MLRSRIAGLAVASAVLIAGSYGFRALTDSSGSVPQAAAPAVNPQPKADTSELNRLIGVFAERAPVRGESLEYRTLGGLYLQRAAFTSNLDDYVRAEAAFSSAVDLYAGDVASRTGLARAALALHDFARASALAAEVVSEDAAALDAVAVLGDAALAMGRYDEAAERYDVLLAAGPGDPAVIVRDAQLAYTFGDTERALRRSDNALQAARQLGFEGTGLAFFESFAGRLASNVGDYERARRHLDDAVAAAPFYPPALGELARVLAAQGDIAGAIERYEQAIAVVPDPVHLSRVGDLYAVAGDTDAAAARYATVEAIATLAGVNRQAYNRTYTQYLLDHDIEPEKALRLAEAELEVRQDAAGFDVHAWALYRTGRFEEARTASDTARATGIADAGVFYHAGLISMALGDNDRARRELEAAVAISPAFDPLHSSHAFALLEELAR